MELLLPKNSIRPEQNHLPDDLISIPLVLTQQTRFFFLSFQEYKKMAIQPGCFFKHFYFLPALGKGNADDEWEHSVVEEK